MIKRPILISAYPLSLKKRSKSFKGEAGFTLAEVMVVLLIIGLLSGAVIMTRPTPKAPEIIQAEAISVALGQAMQTAIITGQPRGFGLDEAGYGFYLFEDGQWIETLQTAQWGPDIDVSFTLEGRTIDLPKERSEGAEDGRIVQVLLEPIGQMSHFSLTLNGADTQRIITSDGSGEIVVTERRPSSADE